MNSEKSKFDEMVTAITGKGVATGNCHGDPQHFRFGLTRSGDQQASGADADTEAIRDRESG